MYKNKNMKIREKKMKTKQCGLEFFFTGKAASISTVFPYIRGTLETNKWCSCLANNICALHFINGNIYVEYNITYHTAIAASFQVIYSYHHHSLRKKLNVWIINDIVFPLTNKWWI